MNSILVIDDNSYFRDSVAAYLKDEGYDVTVAGNGVSGLNLVYQTHPDLVVADIRMPGLGGIALCRLLREGSETRHIPVILMTGVAELETADAIAAGAVTVLKKPFDLSDLVSRIRALLPKSD
jgi:CheY-like chemotaxis protein